MTITIKSATIIGINALPINVEVDAKQGLPGEQIVGLPDTVIRESKSRIKTAITNSGFKYPVKQYTINLAPADIPKEGAFFDLPIAAGLLSSIGHYKPDKDAFYVGELSLSGAIKPIKGILSICELVAKSNIKRLILPYENISEAQLIDEIELFPIKDLSEINSLTKLKNKKIITAPILCKRNNEANYADVKGQILGKRAIEIAAAGHHNLLLIGPPGSGKSMLLKRLPSIMKPLTMKEAIETHKIHSISKLSFENLCFNFKHPFRSPHHTISYAGLVGGGTKPKPGEISLAHNGILFLDELPEFTRQSLEVLRQPLENGNITINRSNMVINYPAKFLLVAAMNPCPCGYYGDEKGDCSCSKHAIDRYIKKISGPILDRFDLIVEIPRLKKGDFIEPITNDFTSDKMKSRIQEAIKIQTERYRSNKQNGTIEPQQIKKNIHISNEINEMLSTLVENGYLTGRSFHKVIKVAQTISDIEKSKTIQKKHILESLQFRKQSLI